VQDDVARREEAIELAWIADEREQAKQVARVGRRERAREAPRQRAEPAGRQPDAAPQPRQVARSRVLAEPEVGLRLDPDRDLRLERPAFDLVAAVHDRVVQAERAQERVDLVRAAEPRLELVRRPIVGLQQHRPEPRVDPRARWRDAVVRAQHRGGDGELERRGGREARLRVPRRAGSRAEALDVDAARPAKGAREAPDRT
jgi:hypothetical protein